METPEFPDLGRHCYLFRRKTDDLIIAVTAVLIALQKIDFLPFTCNSCHQVFCLEHRSYIKHNCPKANKQNVTVVVCPLCAKGVHLIPDEDANITWERHVNTECDPSNYEKATKKKKCPVPGCKELLTFSNIIKCRDCTVNHCLKHQFGPDHKCPGPKKPTTSFPFSGLLSGTSSFRASAEASVAKLSSELSQKWQIAKDGAGQSSSSGSRNGQLEECPQCGAKFSFVTTLVDHVEKVHEKGGDRAEVKKATIDACPKCSKGFRDPAALVEHVERDHGGISRT
ncbi:hypothetical protein PRUPE_7G063600 [Prunus persica]|uniref:C2H2-type domain-containing protein n=1 Tax=Prunus persica TaxID=3760 RepID=A0A251N7L6_PRUPE|nr:hypothetical protein PRUPE_7G063600 [Prunus persica]